MTIHIDEELRATAFLALQNLMTECPEWREDIINIYLRFVSNQIHDSFPDLLEAVIRLLLQLLAVWRQSVLIEQRKTTNIMQSNPPDSLSNIPLLSSTTTVTTPSSTATVTGMLPPFYAQNIFHQRHQTHRQKLQIESQNDGLPSAYCPGILLLIKTKHSFLNKGILVRNSTRSVEYFGNCNALC